MRYLVIKITLITFITKKVMKKLITILGLFMFLSLSCEKEEACYICTTKAFCQEITKRIYCDITENEVVEIEKGGTYTYKINGQEIVVITKCEVDN